MLFVTLTNFIDNIDAISCDGFEIRLDAFESWDFETLQRFCNKIQKPFIITLRKKSQGGFFSGSEKERLLLIERLCFLKPTYLDLEYDTDYSFIKKIHKNHPDIKIILSYHNFEKTPQDLHSLLQSLYLPEIFSYKIATFANSTLDALRMFAFIKENSSTRITGLCMGKEGFLSRITGPIVNNLIDYCSYDESSKLACGQIFWKDLVSNYHYYSINSSTRLFALIGDPVDQSISSFTHNQLFKHHHLNALYLKLRILPECLQEALQLIKKCSFSGLSVTMPLKEKIFSLLDEADSFAHAIQTINTVKIIDSRLMGYNTDGTGCIQALLQHTNLSQKKILILGSGGASKAIGYEALKNQAEIYIYNRTYSKALELVNLLRLPKNHALKSIDDSSYDIVINATSSLDPFPSYALKKDSFVMDLHTYPMMTPFLMKAQKMECHLIFGYEMFINQALSQFDLWFSYRLDQKILYEECLKILKTNNISSLDRQ